MCLFFRCVFVSRAQLRAGFWSRVCVWETRASLRSSLVTKWYLTLVMLGMCLALGKYHLCIFGTCAVGLV